MTSSGNVYCVLGKQEITDIGTFSIPWIVNFWCFCFLLAYNASLDLYTKIKKKYQNFLNICDIFWPFQNCMDILYIIFEVSVKLPFLLACKNIQVFILKTDLILYKNTVHKHPLIVLYSWLQRKKLSIKLTICIFYQVHLKINVIQIANMIAKRFIQ